MNQRPAKEQNVKKSTKILILGVGFPVSVLLILT